MKIIHQNLKKGEVKIRIENQEDLWYLSHIIDTGDLVKGKTLRKIKKSAIDQRASSVTKRPVFMAIRVEKIEGSSTTNTLRVLGTIIEGPEDIPRGTHHSFSLEENTEIKIVKHEWLRFQIDKLKEASQGRKTAILLVVFDREEAYIALMKSYNYQFLTHIKGTVSKKADIDKKQGTFYKDLITVINQYVNRYKIQHVILASPSFWKEELLKELRDDDLKKKIIQATCSSVDKTAFNEVIKRDEVQHALQEDRITSELKIIESLLTEIAKQGKAAYGIKETKNAVEAGAVQDLLISTALIKKKRTQNKYPELDYLMRSVEKMKGKVHIINSDHDGGKKLDGLGGIGGILRYQLQY